MWRSGVAVTVRQDPARVVAVQSSAFPEIDVDVPRPTVLRKLAAGENGMLAKLLPLGTNGSPKRRNGNGATAAIDARATNGRIDIVSETTGGGPLRRRPPPQRRDAQA